MAWLRVVGTKKFHFMSDTKWLLKQGFNTIENLSNGFSLLGLKFDNNAPPPSFKECVKSGECEEKNGLVGILHKSLSFYRLLCKWFSVGVSTRT